MQARFSSAILDGEIFIWNRRLGAAMPFSNIVPGVRAAKERAAAGTLLSNLWSFSRAADTQPDTQPDAAPGDKKESALCQEVSCCC